MPTRIIRVGISRRQSRHFNLAKQEFQSLKVNFIVIRVANYLLASSTATATGAVIPSLKGVTMIFGIPMPCEKDK
jgi:hypothetical protein